MLREGSPCAPATSCLSPHPLSQAAAVPLASWYRMGTVCLCLLAVAASPAPTLPGRWPRLRWCGWTAETGTNALQWLHGDGELWVGGSGQPKEWGIGREQRLFTLTLGALSPFCTPLPPAPGFLGRALRYHHLHCFERGQRLELSRACISVSDNAYDQPHC